jgi:hypothetical protein
MQRHCPSLLILRPIGSDPDGGLAGPIRAPATRIEERC